jgi:glyoxylase-like metal-dependent hydrolase (beta-lactamase superfamily II)
MTLSKLTQRVLGAAFLSLACAVAAPAYAQKTQPPPKYPGYYRAIVGNLTVIALHDGYTQLGPQLFRGANTTDIQDLLANAYLPTQGAMNTSVNAFLVQMGRNLVLVDAGAADCFGPTLGNLSTNLRAAGYSPDAVTMVVVTHLHGDHACGLVNAQGQMAFPKATLWVPRDEAQYWLSRDNAEDSSKHAAAKLAHAALGPYIAAKRLKTFKSGETILPGLTSIPSPGHTPGHTGYLFTSGDHSIYIWGDIIHSQTIQFARPEVSIDFDTDPQQAITTRVEALPEVARKRLLIGGAHLPFPGLGHVRAISAQNGAYQWVPIEHDQTAPGKTDGAVN